MYAQAEERDIMIKVEPFEDRKLYHNPRWTAEAMENILDNAVKYSPSGSVVTVRVDVYKRQGGKCSFYLQTSGNSRF